MRLGNTKISVRLICQPCTVLAQLVCELMHESMNVTGSGATPQAVKGLDELDFDAFLQKSPLQRKPKELDLLMDSLEKYR